MATCRGILGSLKADSTTKVVPEHPEVKKNKETNVYTVSKKSVHLL